MLISVLLGWRQERGGAKNLNFKSDMSQAQTGGKGRRALIS